MCLSINDHSSCPLIYPRKGNTLRRSLGNRTEHNLPQTQTASTNKSQLTLVLRHESTCTCMQGKAVLQVKLVQPTCIYFKRYVTGCLIWWKQWWEKKSPFIFSVWVVINFLTIINFLIWHFQLLMLPCRFRFIQREIVMYLLPFGKFHVTPEW